MNTPIIILYVVMFFVILFLMLVKFVISSLREDVADQQDRLYHMELQAERGTPFAQSTLRYWKNGGKFGV